MQITPVTALTKRIRAQKARGYIEDIKDKRLLDIGCGDKYFLNTFKHLKSVGLDQIHGTHIIDKIDFPTRSFDYVTMLAVIEHLEKPKEVIKECHRVLKDDGLLIITTPKKAADKFINIVYNDYAKIMGEHKQYFDLNDMNDLLDPLFSIRNYKTFLFGLNQLFVCEKRVMDNLNTLR